MHVYKADHRGTCRNYAHFSAANVEHDGARTDELALYRYSDFQPHETALAFGRGYDFGQRYTLWPQSMFRHYAKHPSASRRT